MEAPEAPYLLLLSMGVCVLLVFFFVFFCQRVAPMDALHRKPDLNNGAVSPHNPDLISPTDWLSTHKETSNLDWIVITAAQPIKGL